MQCGGSFAIALGQTLRGGRYSSPARASSGQRSAKKRKNTTGLKSSGGLGPKSILKSSKGDSQRGEDYIALRKSAHSPASSKASRKPSTASANVANLRIDASRLNRSVSPLRRKGDASEHGREPETELELSDRACSHVIKALKRQRGDLNADLLRERDERMRLERELAAANQSISVLKCDLERIPELSRMLDTAKRDSAALDDVTRDLHFKVNENKGLHGEVHELKRKTASTIEENEMLRRKIKVFSSSLIIHVGT